MSKVDKIKLIEAYHTGQLRGKERAAFNRLLQEDAGFQTEVDAYEAIFDGFQSLRRDQFAQTLTEFENDYQKQATQKRPTLVRSLRSYFYMGAAAVLLILSVFVYQMTSNNLFNQHFVASETIGVDIIGFRAAEDLTKAEQVKRAALKAYREKDYKTCIQLFRDYRQNFPTVAKEDFQALVVLGIAQLAQGKADAALETLGNVTNSSDSTYRQEAEWMTALAYIKLDRKEEAAEELKDISGKTGHVYQEKAAALLEDL
jgi:TolA-binding protein